MTPQPAGSLRVERTFPAPVARVFAAWTDPQVLRRWWAAGRDWTTPQVEVDLRVGGRYRLAMLEPDADGPYVVGGEYLEVDPPHRLVYTWRWETPGSPSGALTTRVTVDFHEIAPEQTTVVIVHDGFTDSGQSGPHREGWLAVLDNLDTRVLGNAAP